MSSLRPGNKRQGSALMATLMIVTALVTFLSIGALVTSQFGRYAGRQQGDNELVAAADSGLEYLYSQWKATTATVFNKGVAPVSADFSSMDTTLLNNLNDTSLPFNAAGITFSTANIRLASSNGVADATTTKAVGTPTSNVPSYPGWKGTTFVYVATVTVTPSTTGYHFGFNTGSMPNLTVTRVFQVTQVPLFQAAIFYENNLEIHPGAAMTISGLVHTNGDLWARGFSSLVFKNNVSYVGSYNEKGNAKITQGWDGNGKGIIPGVTSAYANVPLPTWSDGLTSSNSKTRANQLSPPVSPIDPFGGTNSKDNALHDLIEVPTGANKSNNQIVYNNASLIITVNSSVASTDANYLVVTDGAGKSLSDVDTLAVKAAVTVGSGKTMYDLREASDMTVTSLDMAKLALATVPKAGVAATGLQASFATSSGVASGTVYIRDASTSTATEQAIRLINGSILGQNVTVASPNPVYILGDYNTGGTGTLVPSNASNPNGAATPQVTGYNRYSSAVMADAVTILSSAWVDGNSQQNFDKRTAVATTVNTAIMAGDIPSNYKGNLTASGGAHNFPRFLENWSGINFTYWGSLVEAFRSETADGLWQTGNVYTWPDRKWNFDTNFLTTQPPGVPNGISYSRGRWTRANS